MRSQRFASLILFGIAISQFGCTWVPLTPGGEAVQSIAGASAISSEIAGCKEKGAVNAQTRTKIGIFARSEKKIAEELESLARNNAAEMGANKIVAEGPPSVEGRQRFTAYSCP